MAEPAHPPAESAAPRPRPMRAAKHGAAITFGFALACFVSAALFVAILFNPLTDWTIDNAPARAALPLGERLTLALADWRDVGMRALLGGLIGGPAAAVFAALPAGFVILYTEWVRERRLRFYLLVGLAFAAIAHIITVGFVPLVGQRWSVTDAVSLLASLASGLGAALTYWAIAGRRAGFWRDGV